MTLNTWPILYNLALPTTLGGGKYYYYQYFINSLKPRMASSRLHI